MEALSFLWTEGVTRPMANGLVFLYTIVGSNFGLAIILFTLMTRVVMYPLTLKQLRSTRAMQQMAPKMKEVQERYKDDRARQQREIMRMYKEGGVNPLGCLGPMFIQMPIWIGLYSAVRNSLANTPEGLVGLSQKLYSWLPFVNEAIPLHERFLWMDLGQPDPSPIVMPALVGLSTWVVQKMSSVPSMDPKQQSTTNMMNWMMPLIFGFWTLTFPSGLAVYWLGSNLISIALQYRATGWGALARQPAAAPVAAVAATPGAKSPARPSLPPAPVAAPAPNGRGLGGFIKRVFLGTAAAPPAPQPSDDGKAGATTSAQGVAHGNSGGDREDRRGGNPEGPHPTRRRPRRRRSHRRR